MLRRISALAVDVHVWAILLDTFLRQSDQLRYSPDSGVVHDVSDRKHTDSNGFSAKAALWVRTLPFTELLLILIFMVFGGEHEGSRNQSEPC